MVRIFCRNTSEYKEFQEGVALQDALEAFSVENKKAILVAKVNNVVEGLRFRVFNNRDVEFLTYDAYAGRGAYTRSLCFLLCKAAQDVFPGCRVTLRRPISKGYYCKLDKADGSEFDVNDISALRARMSEIVESGERFTRHDVQTGEAIKLFSSLGYTDKVKLIETSGDLYTKYYTLGDYPDMYYGPLVPSVDFLKVWGIEPCYGGILLRVPNRHTPSELAPFAAQPKTFDSLREMSKWNAIMGLRHVGDLNLACQRGEGGELIQMAEALQEKKIVNIAEEIERRYNNEGVRIVLITGPSSSGKTIFCKRLAIQLKVCGLHPVNFSTDDYFVNRVETPLLPDGKYDFDNFETVSHEALQQDVIKLLEGKQVQVPEYNFVTGIREYNGKTLQLGENTVLLIEGIHALNPALTEKIEDKLKYKIFINTITSIALDDHNSIPTSDNRLLRRIVRDFNKGAFSACETISNWPNVRRAEVKWIYPYQESADVLFNSSYLVEFAVLRLHAEHILATVPKNRPEYSEAARLLDFLHYFIPVSDKEIPSTSLLREFVGGSSLR